MSLFRIFRVLFADEPKAPRTDDSACPVSHETRAKFASMNPKNPNPHQHSGGAAAPAEACPVPHETRAKYKNETAYDVYGNPLDPRNQMPATPNHLPVPGQATPLSQARVVSNIPKGGTDGTWLFPSPQQFYWALQRKGKTDDVDERDVDMVVAIHNRMNERTWMRVLQWERMHQSACDDPRLLKLRGRPDDYSPTARWRNLWGRDLPFDRHDWVVDRCGKEVRYVIDYYANETAPPGSNESIEIHVRPALDSFRAAQDRARVRFGKLFNLPLTVDDALADKETADRVAQQALKVAKPDPDDVPADEAEFKYLASLTPQSVGEVVRRMQVKCEQATKRYVAAEGDSNAREAAFIEVRHCMAAQVQSCRKQAETFLNTFQAGAGDETGTFAKMDACLNRFVHMTHKVMAHTAGDAPQANTEGHN
eukprot:TRINITY_DN3970_c0_g4_i1.p1 TRINITY_DN3970_c0_g4~~TRINITY_DN3970_c0_g4_i1.p1  ORF type:complete len:423 (-),score=75.34 TRINITY_DN3970_c0_g4_i1:947-2215(-)